MDWTKFHEWMTRVALKYAILISTLPRMTHGRQQDNSLCCFSSKRWNNRCLEYTSFPIFRAQVRSTEQQGIENEATYELLTSCRKELCCVNFLCQDLSIKMIPHQYLWLLVYHCNKSITKFHMNLQGYLGILRQPSISRRLVTSIAIQCTKNGFQANYSCFIDSSYSHFGPCQHTPSA